MHPVPWPDGSWTAPPVAVSEEGPDLLVTGAEGSDARRHTADGFVHDDGHAPLAALPDPGAVVTLGRSEWSVAPFPAGAHVAAGAYCCAPTRDGLTVRLHRWVTGPADAGLH